MSERFDEAWWLRSAHLQTVWGRLARRRRAVALRREVITTPDDDDLILDHLEGGESPHVLMLHGLEGSSNSVYVQGMLQLLARRGHGATVVNFRACARHPKRVGESIPNRGQRLYHSGETSDLDFVARMLAERFPSRTFAAIGVSLGGNVLLKWLGEDPHQQIVRRAATISVPYDLAAGARHLENGIGRLYVLGFLRTLQKKAELVCATHPSVAPRVDLERGRRAKTFWEFDDAVTAPLHGFRGADDYYERSSSIGYLGRIAVPTLCISAEDDPFLPPAVLEQVRRRKSDAVTLVTTKYGGHVGFIGGPPWRPRYWAEEQAVEFVIA